VVLKKPDLSMGLNGMLAGLVGITAGADVISPWAAVLVGAIAGAIVVVSVIFFDKIRIDDPVGAISVHGVCGIWGTLAAGIFGTKSLFTQLVGTLSISLFAFDHLLRPVLHHQADHGCPGGLTRRARRS
jgi:ammonium transporter, Amt family